MKQTRPVELNAASEDLVGHILVHTEDLVIGQKLQRDLTRWLTETGWDRLTTISVQPTISGPRVEFIPGQIQSNGPKRIGLQKDTCASEITASLRHWLSELDE